MSSGLSARSGLRVGEPDAAGAAARTVRMSQEALLGEREGLASQLLSRRSIGHVFSLRRGKRRRLNSPECRASRWTITQFTTVRPCEQSCLSQQYQLSRTCV